MEKKKKTVNNLSGFFSENAITGILSVLLIAQYIILFYYTFGLTGRSDIDSEYITLTYDSLIVNAVLTSVAITCMCFINRIIAKATVKLPERSMEMIAFAVSIAVVFIGFYWVNASATYPFADSEGICNQAVNFNRGDYSGLAKGEYAGLNLHQLGIITFLRLMFRLFGENNFKSFQYFNAVMSGLFCFSSYRLVSMISNKNSFAEILCLLLTVACAPLHLYVPFVYGEISSTALLITAAWLIIDNDKAPKLWKIIVIGVLCGMAVQFRMNSWILIIGFLIAVLVRFISVKSKWLLFTALSILAITLCFNGIVRTVYRDKIPEDSHPIPAVLYIAMGMMQFDDNQGWFNGYNYNAFLDRDCNTAETVAAGKETIKSSIEHFIEDPAYAREFYVNKFLKQWEAPMFQAVYMNRRIEGEQSEFAKSVYTGKWNDRIFRYMNIYQIMIYGGVLYLMFIWKKRHIGIMEHILLIGIFGSLLFSLIWEAKTRYILPSFLMLIPYASIGLGLFCDMLIERKEA
ncbi:MAG: hypothetical protein IJH37_13320 [Clostridia bacterium]|nr:hypothetical protein [Clostridia bacterium]